MSQRTKKVLIAIATFVLSITLIVLLLLVFYQKAYAGKIYRNIYFADVNLAGKTQKQAEAALKKHFSDILSREITLKSNDKELKTTLANTGITFNPAEIARESFLIGRSSDIMSSTLLSTKTFYTTHRVTAKPVIDQDKYDQFLAIAVEQFESQPQDATLIIENGEIKATESQTGQVVVRDGLADEIINLTEVNSNVLKIETNSVKPNIENAYFEEARTEAESYLNKKIAFAYEGKNYSPTRVDIGSWIEFYAENNTHKARLNDSNIKAYLNKIARNFEVKTVDRKINDSTGQIIQEGKEGIYLNKDEALRSLKNQLGQTQVSVALAVTKETPKEIKVSNTDGIETGKFEGKYIDINLTTQRLCQVENTAIIACYTISSGKPSMPTPVGTFAIQNKNSRAWSAKYGLWMPFWQGFNGPYGLHELPEWPNGYKEGQDHLGRPVSHGCVRLGITDAETVYNWTSIGTPVYIHK